MNLDTQQCEKRYSETQLMYHTYQKATSDTIDIDEIKPKIVDFKNIVSKNLFDKTKVVRGFLLIILVELHPPQANSSASDYIEVLPRRNINLLRRVNLLIMMQSLSQQVHTRLAITTQLR